MGKLIDGQWITDDLLEMAEKQAYAKSDGKFERGTAGFRNWITVDGAAGPSGEGGFKAQAGRYHLFASLNCPWAHRTMLYRVVKKLDTMIGLSLAAPARSDQGWVFDTTQPRYRDELLGLEAVHQLYSQAAPEYTGRVTVPVLWDTEQQTIVSNESSEIIRMFNSAFNHLSGDTQNFYPPALAADIDALNDYIFTNINNGVYKTGFARSQSAYDEAVVALFAALDDIEQRLSGRRYLLGDAITEADWRLLPTLVRFDAGYYTAFKCNLRAIRDYPQLSRYLEDLYQQPGVAQTVDVDVYRRGYHSKSPMRNPYGILPLGLRSTFAQL